MKGEFISRGSVPENFRREPGCAEMQGDGDPGRHGTPHTCGVFAAGPQGTGPEVKGGAVVGPAQEPESSLGTVMLQVHTRFTTVL